MSRRPSMLVSLALVGGLAGCATPSTAPTAPQSTARDEAALVMSGTLVGTVTSQSGTPLAGVVVTVTPTGGSAFATITTDGVGHFQATGVPVNTGEVIVSGLPRNCERPAPVSYTILPIPRVISVSVTVTCAAPGVPTGTITGVVTTSPDGGLVGVNVTVTPTGGAALPTVATTAGGGFSLTGVPAGTSGSGTLQLSGLPGGCTAPAVKYTGLANGGTKTINIAVTCPPPVGIIGGTLLSSLGGGLPGVTVTVTPHGGTALPSGGTNRIGLFGFQNVPVADGTGSISVANLPANCSAIPVTYTGLTRDGSIRVTIVATCTAT